MEKGINAFNPILIAIVIILLISTTGPAGLGSGALVAAWYCNCISRQYRNQTN